MKKKKENYATFDDLMRVVCMLKNSQGFYSRLFEDLVDCSEEQKQAITENFAKRKIGNDNLSIIYELEC